MDQTTKIISLPKPRYLNIHLWTNEEKLFKQREKTLQEIQDLNIPFRTALLNKFSRSVFGPFLQELNEKQSHCSELNQNKIQILEWELKRYTNHDLEIIDKRNTAFPDYLKLLKKAVNTCNVIDLNFLESSLDNLSLNCCLVKQIDNSLRNFIHIQILNLCGNFIEDISGVSLPRKLKFLELFDNFISDVRNLVKYAPKTIMHLGLGRNKLTNDSNLHLLAKKKSLRSLDISDNDICDLKSVLNSLKKMTFLEAFSLEGNQCSVIPDYKNKVLTCFPDLRVLDFTKILDEDYININSDIEEENLSQIMFKCYRIMGLQEPHKDVKSKQLFYLEINFPLLIDTPKEISEMNKESVHIFNSQEENNSDTISRESEKSLKKVKETKNKEKNKKDKRHKSELDLKKGKKKAYFLRDNEYKKNFEKYNVWCKTEKMSWSKIMEFPPIFINASENNLQKIRDTFRSIVPVRLIYLKTAPFSAKDKKGKEKQKKDKNAKKATKEGIDTPTQEREDDTEEESTETILKKVTVASFYCDLKCVNWSDETVDFYWADHSEIGDTALRVKGSLKAIEYDIYLDPKKARERLLKMKEIEIEAPKKEALPTILTCQVGFGLNRY